MKKLLIIFLIIIVIIAAGAGIFIATFDVNRYKPELIKQLENALGSPVKVGGLSLGWEGGVSLQVNQLAVYRDRSSMDKPAVYLERASAKVQLMPLLNKKIEIVSITISGARFNIIKEADGSIHVNGINPPAKPAAAGTAPSAAKTPGPDNLSALTIGVIKIENANIGYVDRSPSAPMKIAVKRLDVLLKNVSLGRPIDFQAKFAVFSEEQNIRFKGRLEVPSLAGPYTLENFELSSDLSAVDLKELEESVPSSKAAGLTGKLAGQLAGNIKRLKIDPKGAAELDSQFNLKDGKISTKSLKSPFQDVDLDAVITKNNLSLKNFSGVFAQGKVAASGVTKNYMSQTPETSLDLKVDQIVLQDVLPQNSGQTQLQGKFSAQFDGASKGFSWPMISQTLTGQGEVALIDGRVVNSNILKVVFDKLAQIPGVTQALNEQLPPQYRQALAQRDTEIGTIRFPVNIVNGVITLPNLKIAVTGFEIYGAGQVSLSGSIDCQTTIVLDQVLSSILITRVPTMQYLADATGRLPFPVHIGGDVNNLQIKPDMDSIFSRVMATHGQELIGNVLDKALKKNKASGAGGEAAASGGQTADANQDPYQKILGNFLQ